MPASTHHSVKRRLEMNEKKHRNLLALRFKQQMMRDWGYQPPYPRAHTHIHTLTHTKVSSDCWDFKFVASQI
jgi:hypothetical protein